MEQQKRQFGHIAEQLELGTPVAAQLPRHGRRYPIDRFRGPFAGRRRHLWPEHAVGIQKLSRD